MLCGLSLMLRHRVAGARTCMCFRVAVKEREHWQAEKLPGRRHQEIDAAGLILDAAPQRGGFPRRRRLFLGLLFRLLLRHAQLGGGA